MRANSATPVLFNIARISFLFSVLKYCKNIFHFWYCDIARIYILSYHLFCFRNIARIANANASAVLLMKCHNKLLKKFIWETISKDGVSAVDIEKSINN